MRALLKIDPEGDRALEEAADIEYYASLSTEERFRMTIERSILLLKIAADHEPNRATPALVKRG